MIEMIESHDLKWQWFVNSLTYEQKHIAAHWLPQQLNSAVNIDKQIQTVKSCIERHSHGNPN